VVDKSAPNEDDVNEFNKFSKHFPKPYTKAEARMLAHDNTNIDESSDSAEDSENEETP
jgi:hypothetical protein